MSTLPFQHHTSAISDVEDSISALWRLEASVSRAFGGSAELTAAAYGILALLEPPAGICLSELAKKLGLGKPGLSRQVTALVEAQLVVRVPDTQRHTAQELRLTLLGQEVLADSRARRCERIQHAFSGWSPTSISDLVRLLTKLNDCHGQKLDRQYSGLPGSSSPSTRSEGRPAN